MADEAERHQEDTLEWTSHPVREQPLKAFLVSVVIMICAQLVGMSVPNLLGGVLAAVGSMAFLFLMLNRFYLPSRYRLDENGIAVRYPIGTRSMRWRDIQRFPHDESGGYLSSRQRGGAFDSRGMSVLFAGQGKEIIPRIQSAMESIRGSEA